MAVSVCRLRFEKSVRARYVRERTLEKDGMCDY